MGTSERREPPPEAPRTQREALCEWAATTRTKLCQAVDSGRPLRQIAEVAKLIWEQVSRRTLTLLSASDHRAFEYDEERYYSTEAPDLYLVRHVLDLLARAANLCAPATEEQSRESIGREHDALAAQTPLPQTSSTECREGQERNDASLRLLNVFTNGLADARIEKASRLLSDDKLTANEKLTEIDALIPFPATASAEDLGIMLRVTKQAVLKTDWWVQNRKGEKYDEVGRRRDVHKKRASEYEPPGPEDADT